MIGPEDSIFRTVSRFTTGFQQLSKIVVRGWCQRSTDRRVLVSKSGLSIKTSAGGSLEARQVWRM